MQISKRDVILGAIGTGLSFNLTGCKSPKLAENFPVFTQIEQASGGRLGVCVLNTKTGETIGNRMNERFAMCSTFKLPLAAMILREIDAGNIDKDAEAPISADGLKVYSAKVATNLARGKMKIIELCEAAQITSDNIAANALLKVLGGPEAFTNRLRALGDKTTNLNRIEPHMNLVSAQDTQDTSTPLAFSKTIEKMLIGNYLSKNSRAILLDWMVNTKTGTKRLRAGLPQTWLIGDKTGTAIDEKMSNKYNDIALIIPKNNHAFIISSYFESDKFYDEIRDIDQKVLADVGKIAADWIAKLI